MTTPKYRDEARAIGRNLKVARQAAKFRTAAAAHAEMAKQTKISLTTFQKHESGARRPSEEKLRLYAKLYRVKPETLLGGATEVNETVNTAAVKVNKQTHEINDNFSFIIPQIRHIPVFTAQDVGLYVLKGMPMTQAPHKLLPLPAPTQAGPRAFGYEMPEDDKSMFSPVPPSITPGTVCIIDPDRTVKPGDFVLASGGEDLMAIRRYQAEGDYAPGKPFSLIATSPLYVPLEDAHNTWQIIGRVIGLHIAL